MTTTTIQAATAVGYFRVSSSGQAGERHVSLDVQAAAFNHYCLVHQLSPLFVLLTLTLVGRMIALNTWRC